MRALLRSTDRVRNCLLFGADRHITDIPKSTRLTHNGRRALPLLRPLEPGQAA